MADSIAPMPVTTTKSNVFAETTLTNATGVLLQNIGGSRVYFGEKATSPTTEIGGYIDPGEWIEFDTGSNGIWLWTNVTDSLVAAQAV